MTSDLSGSSIIVTGAAGFVGAHLVARLNAQGATVCGLTHKGHRTTRLTALGVDHCGVAIDLTDAADIAEVFDKVAPDFIFHLAAERDEAKLIADPDRSATTGAALIHAAARFNVRRFVTIGSSLEYPDPVSGKPVGPHGSAKAHAMKAMQNAAIEVGMPFSSFRTHYVYGPLHGAQKLIPTAIRAATSVEPLSVTGADIRKRFVYVKDIVDACLHILNLPADPKNVYLATATDQHTNHEIITRIGKFMGKEIRLADAFVARDWDRTTWDLPTDAMLLPGWAPKTGVDQGLKACIAAEGFDVCN